MKPSHHARRERGAALLMAMLTVTLVATFAATALWQQWRAVEVEAAERARAQSSWVLVGALDWSRLILRQDAMPINGNSAGAAADHLGEPWAVPLQETRMSTFLAADKGVVEGDTEDLPDVFLSGRIIDAQSRLNVSNLVNQNSELDTAVQLAFIRLFARLNIPPIELQRLVEGLLLARSTSTTSIDVPLLPQRFEQLAWLGLSPATLQALAPYVTVLDTKSATTPLNLNTASGEVIVAAVPDADPAGVERLLASRARSHLRSIEEAAKLLGPETKLEARHFDVRSSYFEVHGRLRLEGSIVNERSLVQRASTAVTTVWRERTAGELLP